MTTNYLENVMKRLILFLSALFALGASASVTELHQWQPKPGRYADFMNGATEARTIHEKLGATVYIGTNQMGVVHYALTFPDWGAWGEFSDKLVASKEWMEFNKKYDTTEPTAEHVGAVFFDSPVEAKTQMVLAVSSWKVQPGKLDSVVATMQQFVPIDTKLGASVGIDIDALGNAHYEASFATYAAYGKWLVAIQKSAERAALIKKADASPEAELVGFYLIEQFLSR
jgi:hypothetical protein